VASLFAHAARRASLRHIRRLAAIRPGDASRQVAAIYDQVEAEFGMLAPPVALHAPAPEVLEAVWLILRETLLAGDPADRAEKEVVAAAVSAANSCPYCVQVHGAALRGVRDGDDSALVAAGRAGDVRDLRLRSLALWVQGVGAAPAWLTPQRAASFVGVAVTFHYLNRMVNLFLEESPLFGMPAPGRALGLRAAPRIFGRLAKVAVSPGIPASDWAQGNTPGDLAWAVPLPPVADAMSRGCARIETAGVEALPPRVRALVCERLDDPAEAGPGLALRPWLDAVLGGLPGGERHVARLALLTAYASQRVTDADIADFRAAGGLDDALVRLTAWASMAAARRAGRMLGSSLEGFAG